MVIAQLTEGDHTITWSLAGYDTLTATIHIDASGAVTCKSVSDSTCSAPAAPRITISGLTVTGYLRAATTPTPTPTATPTPKPTTTPTPAGGLCGWMVSKGGPSNIKIPDVISLEDAYLGFGNLSFTPTNTQIVGMYDYYLGFIGSGNTKTGCSY